MWFVKAGLAWLKGKRGFEERKRKLVHQKELQCISSMVERVSFNYVGWSASNDMDHNVCGSSCKAVMQMSENGMKSIAFPSYWRAGIL